jgi:hypothetical protein
LSQNQLAQRPGLKERQIQWCAAAEYVAAKVERTEQVVWALGLKVRGGRKGWRR